MEEKIYRTEELIKQIIAESELNVSIIELILRGIHLEVAALAEKNLENRRREEEQRLVAEKATMEEEELNNGDSSGV